jgi:hypothetical protein
MGARIGSPIAIHAARNLAEGGWRTPRNVADSTWRQRVLAFHDAGYTGYQERTSTMPEHVLERWNGDVRGCARRPSASRTRNAGC